MHPILFQIDLAPTTATRLLYVLAFVVPGAFAFRAWQDVRVGLESDKNRPWKVLGVGIPAALIAVRWFLQPHTWTDDLELPLHIYGLMIATAFISAIAVTTREARRTGLDPNHILDLAFWVLLSGLVGSRILFIIVNADDYFGANFFASDVRIPGLDWRIPTILVVWRGGLVFYGGLIGAFLAVTYYLWKFKLPYFRYVDAIVPAVPLGHFFGRLGCFAAGCCWGKACPSDSFFATYFPGDSLAYAQTAADTHIQHLGEWTTVAVYPTQLFESVGTLLIFGLLLLVRRHKRFHGMVLITYFIVYPLFRTVNETFRGDFGRGLLFRWPAENPVILSTSQIVSVIVAAIGIGFIIYRLRALKNARMGSGAVPA